MKVARFNLGSALSTDYTELTGAKLNFLTMSYQEKFVHAN